MSAVVEVGVTPRSSRSYAVEAAATFETIVRVLAVVLASVLALVSLVYTFLTFPQADDLERTAALRIFTAFQRTRSDYMGIDGRWASKLLEYAAYSGGHVIGRYPFLLSSVLLILFIGCCCLVSIVSGRRILDHRVIASGLIAYSFVWVSAPRGEVFYWFPAAAEYVLSISLSFVLLWLLYNARNNVSKALVICLAFVLAPLHEAFGSWVFAVLAVTWAVRVVQRKPGARLAAAAAIASFLGTLSVVVAPGIRARAATNPHQAVPASFSRALQIEGFNTSHWLAIAAVFLVVVLFAASTRVRPSWYMDSPRLTKICLLIAIFPLPVLMLTLISYGLGGNIPARVYDGFYFLFAAAAGTFAAACGFDLSCRRAARTFLHSAGGSALRAVAAILAIVAVVQIPRYHAAFRDIETAIRNHSVWAQRNTEIWNQARSGATDVVIGDRMLPLSMLPFDFDITDDPKWYSNVHLASYYGLHTLRLSSPMDAHQQSTLTENYDQILTQPPAGVSQKAPVACDFGVDSINGAPPASGEAVKQRLSVIGWTAISTSRGIAPTDVFLTLSNPSQTLYVRARMVPRLDVNQVFGQPAMGDTGFKTNVDVSGLNGEYKLGISRVFDGQMDSCSQFHLPLHFAK